MIQRKRRLFTILCGGVLLLTAVVAVRHLNADTKIDGAMVYGTGGDTDLQLDLARPSEADAPRPAVIFIHGGGWTAGHRWVHRAQIREAAERGYVAASISYRLMKIDRSNKERPTAEPTFPAQVHDAKAAVRWLRANAQKYNIDPDRIGVVGFSAGGHLALMLGLTDASAGLEGEGGHAEQSSRVQAVVNFFGPTEMVECEKESTLAWLFPLFLDGTPEEVPERYQAASPITYASQDDPPVLTIHGDKDNVVPVNQARVLDEKMKAAGASHKLMVLEGQPHGISRKYLQQVTDAAFSFLDEQLKTP